jgi:hypothetical protein
LVGADRLTVRRLEQDSSNYPKLPAPYVIYRTKGDLPENKMQNKTQK